MDAWPWLWAAALGAATVWLWLWLVRPLGHWRRRGVPYAPGLPLFGNYLRVITQRASAGEVLAEIYRKFEGEALVGVFQFREPSLLVRDPELVRAILVKDFAHFRDNVFPVNAQLDPLLARNPFVLSGDEWKTARGRLTVAFTSGRIRAMLPLLEAACQRMVQYTRDEAPARRPGGVDAKELAARYTTEAVASVAFGVSANCFAAKDPEIRRMNRQILEPGGLRMLQLTLKLFLPKIGDLLRVRMMPLEVDRYFRRLVREAVAFRQRSGEERADFLQTLLQIRNKSEEAGDTAYGEEDMTAHALSFFVDGFETSSVALSMLLHDLAHAPAAQQRLRAELRPELPLDAAAALQAPFLDACVRESLRLHPPGMFLRKRCTAAWRAPGGAELRPGDDVLLPLLALHTDERLHPRALCFWPQRWLPEEAGGAPPPRFAALPFGEGPRQCLGMRFAVAQVKLGAAALVRHFDVRLTPRSPPNPPPLDPSSFLYAAKGGLWLDFVPLPPAADAQDTLSKG